MWQDKRSTEQEILDLGGYTDGEYESCLELLDRVNWLLGGYAATKKALIGLKSIPASILDVGCGGGYLCQKMHRWFPQAKILGIDISQKAIDYAKTHLPQSCKEMVAFSLQKDKALDYPDKSFDVVTTMLVCHHMTDEELVLFLKESYRICSFAVVINDLHRHILAYISFSLIALFAFPNRLIWHDGRLSVRRSFRKSDWLYLLEKAGFQKKPIRPQVEFSLSLDFNSGEGMKTDFLVIGGGIAGLSAANTLAERGANVTLLEGGSYPSHKICGEFLSPEALPLIEKWGIEPAAYVTTLKAVLPNRELFLKLPEKAAAIPRYVFDEALAKRAAKHGAQILTHSSVERIEVPKSSGHPYVVRLASGEQWTSPVLLVSTGRLVNTVDGLTPPKLCYIGAKTHFEGIDCQDELIMHLMPGAYFGMVSIGPNRVNVAGLMTCTALEAKNPKAAFDAFFERPEARSLKEALRKGHNLFNDWIVGPVPEFGMRKQPQWPNAYFIGDAAGIIPPATGNGLAMGLTSGILAADYALKGLPEAYRERWAKEYSGRIGRGKLLHKLFLSPRIADPLLRVGNLFPNLVNLCFRATRGAI